MKTDFMAQVFNNQNEIETSIYKAKKKYSEYHETFKFDRADDDSEGDETNFRFERKGTRISESNSPNTRKTKVIGTPKSG